MYMWWHKKSNHIANADKSNKFVLFFHLYIILYWKELDVLNTKACLSTISFVQWNCLKFKFTDKSLLFQVETWSQQHIAMFHSEKKMILPTKVSISIWLYTLHGSGWDCNLCTYQNRAQSLCQIFLASSHGDPMMVNPSCHMCLGKNGDIRARP